MLQVFEHLATRLGTVTARLRALGHVLVVLVLFAGPGALVAGPGAGLADRPRKGAPSAGKRGRQRTDVAAVGTGADRPRVLLLPVSHQVNAVVEAGGALQLAVGAGPGAFHELLVMPLVGTGGRRRHQHQGRRPQDGSGGGSQHVLRL